MIDAELRSYDVLYIWLAEVLGYILLACFEEYHLSKVHKDRYQEYRLEVPFLFPVPSPSAIPQPLFSMLVALLVAFLCLAI